MAHANPGFAATNPNEPPNIILIVCDDLGYGDLGLYGSPLQRTPHVQRLAAEGVTLSDFYVTSGVCTPSRSSMMTGSYPRRTNMYRDTNGIWVLLPVSPRGLHANEWTVPEMLKQRGYATAMIGKWHLGDQPDFLPTRHGFDSWFGIPYSNNMYHGFRDRRDWPPLPLMRDEKVVETNPDQDQFTARFTAAAVEFINQPRSEPFFLFLAHPMPHFPIAASERFRGGSANGIFGDAVEELDWSVGEILAALDKRGIAENTLIIFTSDNGADGNQPQSNQPLRGFKGTTLEGGMRVPFAARWPARIPAGIRSDALTSTLDFLPTFAAITGASQPAENLIDGHDILPIWTGQPDATSPYEAFFYYYIDQLQAVRAGPWKLHVAREGNQNRREPEQIEAKLYNLALDVTESHNVIDQHREIVHRLTGYAEAIRRDIGDRDIPGRNQRPAGHVANPVPLVPIPTSP